MSFLKSYLHTAIYGAILTMPSQASSDSAAILGGIHLTGSGPAYAALVSSSGELSPLRLPGDAAMGGTISSVSMNSSGNSLIGGEGQTGAAYAAIVSPSGGITSLTFSDNLANHGAIYGASDIFRNRRPGWGR